MKQIGRPLIALILFLIPVKATLSEVKVSINLHNSQIEGVFDSDYELYIFRGIPYAKPPIGDLRWQSPVPLSPDPEVINAQSFKPACMQDEYTTVWYQDVAELFDNPRSVFQHVDEVSEDCLYLNIWTNSLDQTSKKPVMVWVHGGADTAG
jgi:para-nitrobenzyl esterase